MPLQAQLANISPPMALSPPPAAHRVSSRVKSKENGASLPRPPSIQDNRDQSLDKLSGVTDASRQYRTRHQNASTPTIRLPFTKRRSTATINIEAFGPESTTNSQSPTRRQYSRFSKPLPPIPSKPPAGNWGKVDPFLRDMGVPVREGGKPVFRQAPVRRATEERAEVVRSVHCAVEEM